MPLNYYSTFLEYSAASLFVRGAILPYRLQVMGYHEQSAHCSLVFGPKAWVPGAGLRLQGCAAALAGLHRTVGDIPRGSSPGRAGAMVLAAGLRLQGRAVALENLCRSGQRHHP